MICRLLVAVFWLIWIGLLIWFTFSFFTPERNSPEAVIFRSILIAMLGFPWGVLTVWIETFIGKLPNVLASLFYLGVPVNFMIALLLSRKCLRSGS
jgi:hypothetical protein